MDRKTLRNLIALSSNVRLYVPSTTDVDKACDTSAWVDRILSAFSGWYGGATSYAALGCWVTNAGALVKEAVTIVESFCSEESLRANCAATIELAETMKRTLGQEAVSLEVNNKLYFV